VVTTAIEESGDEDQDNAPPEPKAKDQPKGGQDQKKDDGKTKGK
jgi:hypothetical protein